MTDSDLATPADPLDGLEDRLAAIANAHAEGSELRPDDVDAILGAVRLLLTAGDAMVTHDGATRVRRMVAAETELVGLRAQTAALTARLEETEYERYNAEQALAELRDNEPRRCYVPGDAEPDPDETPERPLVLCSLGGSGFSAGRLFARTAHYSDIPWRSLDLPSSAYDWRSLMEHAPLLDVTGGGAWRLAEWARAAHEQQDETRRQVWQLENTLRAAAAGARGLAEGSHPPLLLPPRHPAGSPEERRAVVGAVLHALERLPYYAAKGRAPAAS